VAIFDVRKRYNVIPPETIPKYFTFTGNTKYRRSSILGNITAKARNIDRLI
jgi:hypothetical protein